MICGSASTSQAADRLALTTSVGCWRFCGLKEIARRKRQELAAFWMMRTTIARRIFSSVGITLLCTSNECEPRFFPPPRKAPRLLSLNDKRSKCLVIPPAAPPKRKNTLRTALASLPASQSALPPSRTITIRVAVLRRASRREHFLKWEPTASATFESIKAASNPLKRPSRVIHAACERLAECDCAGCAGVASLPVHTLIGVAALAFPEMMVETDVTAITPE
jgi:hypothetical protein